MWNIFEHTVTSVDVLGHTGQPVAVLEEQEGLLAPRSQRAVDSMRDKCKVDGTYESLRTTQRSGLLGVWVASAI